MNSKKQINWWKWAFITLVLLIVISCGVVLQRATAPVPQAEMSQTTRANESSLMVECLVSNLFG